MSLDYDLRTVHPDAKTEGAEWAITEGLIWMTIGVGLGEITEDNYIEFTVRNEVVCHLMHIEALKPATLDQVKLRIGLKTNVTTESRLEFLKRVVNRSMDDRLYTLKREQSEEKN